MKKLMAILAVLLPLTGAAQSLQYPVYDCHRAEGKIKIDGKLAERAWQEAAPSAGFRDIRGEGWPAPTMPTVMKMLYDDEYLYIGGIITESDVTGSLTEHDSIIYRDNDFEVFIDPYGDGKLYYEFECNAKGTLMDLMMEKPYYQGGNYIMGWDCPGIRLAVSVDGTLNRSSDTDRAWYVEMAIPFASLDRGGAKSFDSKLWRMNFSRVEWLRKEGPEENWVWSPTGVVDIHRPDRWGYVRFIGDWPEPRAGKVVKNWMWEGPKKDWTDEQYRQHFKKAYDCGISAFLFEGYDERIYRLCHEAGLEAHYWLWTLNRHELTGTHPEWYAVSREGKSCATDPPYVGYYHFLCPSHPEVAQYLAEDYVKMANMPYVDGMQLDYVRMPDVVLPVGLWGGYGIDQTKELPEYDFCYCDLCREEFKKITGRDPLEVKYPSEDQSWINFRMDAVTGVVKTINDAMKKTGKPLSAAVFPGPSMARKMVRQDWGNWPLGAYFPMIYNGFYYEGVEWIGRSVAESVKAVGGNAKVFAGLFVPDIKYAFEKALDEAYGNGAAGISFFAGPDDEYLERLKSYMDANGMIPYRK